MLKVCKQDLFLKTRTQRTRISLEHILRDMALLFVRKNSVRVKRWGFHVALFAKYRSIWGQGPPKKKTGVLLG
jgi:hypothetical protein